MGFLFTWILLAFLITRFSVLRSGLRTPQRQSPLFVPSSRAQAPKRRLFESARARVCACYIGLLTRLQSCVAPTPHFMYSVYCGFSWPNVSCRPVQMVALPSTEGHVGLQEAVGTHGAMKCIFEGQVLQKDAVCVSLYKRAFPVWPATDVFT